MLSRLLDEDTYTDNLVETEIELASRELRKESFSLLKLFEPPNLILPCPLRRQLV